MRILNVFCLFREIMFETVCEMTGLPKNDEKPSSFCELPCTWAMKNPYTRSCLLIHGWAPAQPGELI